MRRSLAISALLSISALATAGEAMKFKLAKEIALPGATGFDLLSFEPASRRLLVAHGTKIEVLDVEKGEKVGAVEGLEGAHMAVIVPGSKLGFATEGKKKKVAVFDTDTWKVTKEVDAGEGADAILYVTTVKEVWVMNHKAGSITCVDVASLEVKATITVGGALELAAEYAAKGLVFVNVEDRSHVASIDAKTHAVVARLSLDPATEPTGIALDEKRGLLFCGCAEKLAIVDATSGKVLSTLPIGAHCDSVAFDPEQGLAFASCGDGTTTAVREIDPKTFEVVAKFDTAPGGRTCALDPKSHALWVAAGTRGKDDVRVLEFVADAGK